ncbi:hypothetical protein P5673_024939, partial [Acropora cervicornis]
PQTLITYTHKATTLLKYLGFTIHEGKSLFAPSQRVAFLGFVLDSNTMTASMKSDKAVTVKTAIGQLLRKERPQISEVASVVGLMVSCFPGVKYAPLFYRALENDKTDALKKTGWNNDEHMQISDLTKKDLSWWLENVDHDPCPIIPKEPSKDGEVSLIILSTTYNGRWSPQESAYHINYLEIKAVLFDLKSLCSKFKHCSIKVLSDNQTAVAYLRNMDGTHSRDCNQITRETILWCEDRGMSLTITRLSGKLNVEADKISREESTQKQYKTSVSAWLEYCKKQGISVTAPSLPQLLDFLTIQSHKLGYSALGTIRSALSSFITID